ncbi:MAG TPA: hypothetical protein VGG34_14250 [Opitutaceae bacterium]|jgi:hypothetical protein
MQKLFRNAAPVLLLALAQFLGTALAQGAAQPAHWDHIKTSIFFTSDDVKNLLWTPKERQATLAYFAPLRFTKVYLENRNADPSVVPKLKEIAADLRSHGIEVSGAVVPADHGPLSYNEPGDMALLEGRIRVLAQAFDEIIVDDWLFTISTSEKSVADRGNQSWADYRSRLVAEQAKKHMIDFARQVNPKCDIIIKYPNWYEGHRQNGYDVALQTPQFASVSVGIESRQLETQDQHIPAYSAYVYQKWIGGNAGAKWRSSWLDNFQMEGDYDEFAAEVWQAVLARSPEILFWCAGQLHPPTPAANDYPPLCEMMPEFDRLAGMLEGPSRGIPFHLPLGAVGEYNIFGYLGMMGLPIEPVTAFPADAKDAIFTKHSLRDPKVADELLASVKAGHEVFLSWPLLRDLRGSELQNAFNVIDDSGTVTSSEFRVRGIGWRPTIAHAGRQMSFPLIRTSTWPYVRDIALVREDGDFGVLLSTPYMEGKVDVLNLPDNYYDLLRLPDAALNEIRNVFYSDLGVRLVGPGRVALYPFGDRQYVVYNMNESVEKVGLRFPAGTPVDGWTERMHGERLVVTQPEEGFGATRQKETQVELTLRPYELALVEKP